MAKLNCPYCSKKYTKPKHFETHIETKHRKLIDLISAPLSEKEWIEQEVVNVRIPRNPIDMTPDILMRLSLEKYAIWLMELHMYKYYQAFLTETFAHLGIQEKTVEQKLPPKIEKELKELEMYKMEESIRKVTQPILEEVRDLRHKMLEKENCIFNEISKIKSSLDIFIIASLDKQSEILELIKVGLKEGI